MHTITIPATASTPDIRLHYNSDWSGNVLIQWEEFGERVSAEFPAPLLLAGSIPKSCTINRDILCVCIAAAVRASVIALAFAALENLE